MLQSRTVAAGCLLVSVLTLIPSDQIRAQGAPENWRIPLERPGDREFIVDKADLIDDADEKTIRDLCDKLLTEKMVPIIVVTIPSMAEYEGTGMRIETFAQILFDQWGIGFDPAKTEVSWNRGMLLLVSEGDRKARIELGNDWNHEKDTECTGIMEDFIIPRFKEGDYSKGIVAGVEALDKLARGLQLPARPKPKWFWPVVLITIGLMIFTAVSLYRRGASGWAWLFWGVAFTVIFFIIRGILTSSARSGGGGYGGGSFGGGFSGGGGATGSW